LITNPRPQGNAVVNWKAQVKFGDRFVDVPVPSGELTGLNPPTPYGVIPLSVPAYGAVEAHLCLFELPPQLKAPVKVKLTCKDVFGKAYHVQCLVREGTA
jgi:hypothetical protein